MNAKEREALAAVALIASLADGDRGPEEQQQLETIAREVGGETFDAMARQILAGQVRLDRVAERFSSPEGKRQAYELAVMVCHADGSANEKEKAFLADLKRLLGTDGSGVEAGAAGLAVAPVAGPALGDAEETQADQMILKNAILAGALELLPQNLASLAIIPLQLRMVYRIGARHGHALGANQVKDLAGTLGIGAAAQVMEGVARRALGGLARGVFGRVLGGIAGGAAGAAAGVGLTFASTYALGHVAEQYYAKGRSLSGADLRALFTKLKGEAATIYPKVEAEIKQQASGLNLSQIMGKLKAV